MFWIIFPFIALYFMYWVATKLYLTYTYDDKWHKTFKPFGLKLWQLFLMIIVAILPIINVVGFVAAIIVIFAQKYMNNLDWDEIFPKSPDYKPSKFLQFLNKEVGKKK